MTKPVPSRPKVILRTKNRTFAKVLTNSTHHFLHDRDGEEATIVEIPKDCGGMFDFWVTIELKPDETKYWKGDIPVNIQSSFLEFVDQSLVPESRTQYGEPAIHAYLCCHYRDEAWQTGEFAPPDEKPDPQ